MSRELKSTDEGAPQLAGNSANSLNAVLKAALVTGYGNTTPLGWELVHEDVNLGICVFRPKTGSRMFLQITDDNTFGNGRCARAISYEIMPNASTGMLPGIALTSSNPAYYIHKIYTDNNNSASPWYIIGDEVGFYLCICVNNYNSSSSYRNFTRIYYFGEGLLLTGTTYTSNYNWLHWTHSLDASSSQLYGNAQVYIIRDPYTQLKGCVVTEGFQSIQGLVSGTADIGARYGGSIGGVYGYTPIHLIYNNDVFACNLPGIFEPLFPSTPAYKRQTILYEDIDENNRIVSFPCGPLGTSNNYLLSNYLDSRLSILIGDKFRYAF